MKLYEVLNTQQPGTYAGVRFTPQTCDALIQYTRDGKIPNPLPVDQYHTTVLYSRKPCPDYEPLGDFENPWSGENPRIEVWPTQSETKKCLVVAYDSKDLTDRHNHLMKQHQATYDFSDYKPHITLSYDVGDDLSIDDLPDINDYLDQIMINHEYYEPLKEMVEEKHEWFSKYDLHCRYFGESVANNYFGNDIHLYEGLIKSYPITSIINAVKQIDPTVKVKYNTKVNEFVVGFVFNYPMYFDIQKLIKISTTYGWSVATINTPTSSFKSITEFLNKDTKSPNKSTIEVVMEANYGFDVTDGIIKSQQAIYHATRKGDVDKILKIGLIPKSKNKKATHPDRVYFTRDKMTAKMFASQQDTSQQNKYVILTIDTKAFDYPGVRLFNDPAFPSALYTLSNIGPQFIRLE